jgi:hypothetical protein
MRRLICISLLLVLATCRAEQTNISRDIVSGRTYYHLLFPLTPTNSSLVVPPGYKDPIYRTEDTATFDGSGLFEVYIRASEFPLPAPGCNGGWIILRMPATGYDASDIDTKVAAKRELWDRLQKMYTSKSGSIEVVIELNPYVRVVDAPASKLELEYCNVFFRQAYGGYVPYVGPLKSANKPMQPTPR